MAHTKKTIAGNVNNGTANTFSYSGSFDVFKASEVEVELDNIKLTFTTSTINESADPREYTVDYNNKTVHIGGANLTSSHTVVIQPVTDMGAPTPRATYSPGASVTSADLNNNQLQVMRKAMEYDEQKLSSRGGTMTGNLHMGQNVDLSFEGDTDNAYETTITVADPTADRTITFPDTTGTVVTTGDTGTVATGMIAADAITGAKIADDAINSEHIADGSVDLAHLSSNSVDSSKIVDGSIVAADLASDAVTTVKITDDAVTADKLANTSVTAGSYTATDLTVDAQGRITAASSGTIATSEIADDAITGAKIADDSIDSEHYVDGSIDTAHIANAQVTTAKLADSSVTTGKIADGTITSLKIAAGNITNTELGTGSVATDKLAADAVTNAKIADDSIDSEHYVDGSIDTAHIGATQVTDAKLASNSVTTSKITDANVTTDKIADSNVTLAKLASDLKQTTISNSDTQLPTSGAVVDYVAAQIAPIGGLEVIADEDNFPTSQPGAGVVISISDAAGIVVNGSGVSTTARTAGNGSDNVTINNFPSSLYGETLATGVGLMVSSTGSSQTYNYHKILAAETDVKQLSDDINDFNARYRVNAGEPGSNNDAGDLVYDTNADKMKVYDGTAGAWKEVTSTGDFKYLFLCPAGGSGSPTLNGSIATYDLRESSNSGAAASVSSAAQLIVSINGVVQKANTGTSAPSEGFALVDSNTIIFGANLQSGDSVFIIQIGSAVTIPTPGDGTVSTAKIVNGAVTTDKIADDAVTTAKIGNGAVNAAKIADGTITNSKLVGNTITSSSIANTTILRANMANNSVGTTEILDEAVTLAKLEHGDANNDGKFLRANNGADPTFETINVSSDSITEGNSTFEVLDTGSNGIARFLPEGSEVFRISTDGKTGIGTNNPGNLLHLKGSGHDKLLIESTGTAHSVGVQFKHASGDAAEQTWQIQTNAGASTERDLSVRDATAGAFIATFRKGGGITFGGDTAEANALHDYEEGTWTGAIETGTANINNEWYIKIGGYVVGGASITAISDTSSGNTVKVTGLPYSNSGGGNCPGTVAGSKISCFDKTSMTQVSGTSVYFLKSSTSSGSWNYVLHSDVVQSSGSITFGFHYYCTS